MKLVPIKTAQSKTVKKSLTAHKKTVTTKDTKQSNDSLILPFFVTVHHSNVNGDRYLLIHKKTLACLSAQNTLDELLSCVTRMTTRCGRSFEKLVDYVDNAYLNSDYSFKPEPTVFEQRKGLVNSDYDSELWDAINKSVGGKAKLRRKKS